MQFSLSQYISLWAGTGFAGLTVGAVAHWFAQLMLRRIHETAASWDYDAVRLETIRKQETLFRWFEPLIKEIESFLGPRPKIVSEATFQQIQLDLKRGGHALPFEPAEFIAYQLFQGVLGAVGLVLLLRNNYSLNTLLAAALIIPFAAVWSGAERLKKNSDQAACSTQTRVALFD